MKGWIFALSAVGLVLAAPASAQAPVAKAGAQAQVWSDAAKLPNLWQGTWQGDTDLYAFPGPIDYTPEGADYVKTYRPPEDSEFANCAPPALPFAMRLAAMPLKFYYSPHEKMISIYIEGSSMVRFIYMDGRQHSEEPNPTYLGESVGRWDGNDLVIDTVGFVPQAQIQIGQRTEPGPPPILAYASPKFHMVERLHLVDDKTFELQTTLDDPKYFAKPYTYKEKYYRYTGRLNEPQEWTCSHNTEFLDPKTGKLHYGVTNGK